MDSNDSHSVVLITGASNGLGKALAVVYAKAGHNLLLTGRDTSALQETVAIAEGAGVTVFSIVQDFTASDAIDKIMAFIESNHLTVAVLILMQILLISQKKMLVCYYRSTFKA